MRYDANTSTCISPSARTEQMNDASSNAGKESSEDSRAILKSPTFLEIVLDASKICPAAGTA